MNSFLPYYSISLYADIYIPYFTSSFMYTLYMHVSQMKVICIYIPFPYTYSYTLYRALKSLVDMYTLSMDAASYIKSTSVLKLLHSLALDLYTIIP